MTDSTSAPAAAPGPLAGLGIVAIVVVAVIGWAIIGDIELSWPNAWTIDFPNLPELGEFPSWDDIFNLVWKGLKALGDLVIPWPTGFSVDFPNPGIPGFDVPGLARGGYAPGGLAMVGERGPE
ncbi:MAG: hypothetical protein ACK5B7_12840, partial [Novosphingobium sp.]